ncbi:AtpZ/AtpI family protein [Flavobacterium sp. MFBS3-15]|uniref:AtpZ/AtpI family protein n=1 Tax=Flavobacterium sp. MFBS3-15 TaxID=2989816 RepID=UPI002236743A|nr:AtpZ/AtpI family protein [Flavobacterium sp. MFBS3-15]MCW4469196.1 AtpZ/AtpI family protein [Flavobacterium sp. MFBS3-15]
MRNNRQDKNKKWIALINIPFQMGVIICAGVFFGLWLDKKTANTNSLYTIIFSLLSVFIALYNVIRQVKNLGEGPK